MYRSVGRTDVCAEAQKNVQSCESNRRPHDYELAQSREAELHPSRQGQISVQVFHEYILGRHTGLRS